MAKSILLDTSLITACIIRSVDFTTELQKLGFSSLVIPQVVKDELERLSKTKGDQGKAAKLGLELIKHKKLEILENEPSRHADDVLVELASSRRYAVGTQDIDLKRRLHAQHVQTVSIRDHGILGLD